MALPEQATPRGRRLCTVPHYPGAAPRPPGGQISDEPLRLTVVPGVTPTRWVRTWDTRHPRAHLEVTLVEESRQLDALRDLSARLAFVRLPVDREGLHVIPLWHEDAVVVVSREHVVSVVEEVVLADLAEDHAWDPTEVGVREAVEAVAAGTGVVVLPAAVARLHHRKDVVAVPVTDAPQTRIGLAWRVDDDDPRIDDFVGVVRGRTERSTRGSTPTPPAPKPATPGRPAQKASAARAGARRPRPGGGSRGRGRARG